MEIHYQPNKPLMLLTTQELQERLMREEHVGVMHYSPIKQNNTARYFLMPKNKEEYAQRLYDMLHQIDATSVEKIFVEIPPYADDWLDIHDRLTKAAVKN